MAAPNFGDGGADVTNQDLRKVPSTGIDMIPQLHNLRLLIVVIEARSIARASRQIGRAPSAASRSIVELERAIGAPMLERKWRGVVPTTMGAAVVEPVRHMVEVLTDAVSEFTETTGHVRMSRVPMICNYLFNGRRLQLILELGAFRSLTAAAENLGLSSAGVSMALARIEAQIGHPIFDRTMNGLEATTSGERLIRAAKQIFEELRQLNSKLASISEAVSPCVVIGTIPLMQSYMMPKAIAAALANLPRLRVVVFDAPYAPLLQALRDGDADAGIVMLRPGTVASGMVVEPLFTDELAVVASSRHHLADSKTLGLADLLQERWILPRAGSQPRKMVHDAFAQAGIAPPLASMETQELAMIRQSLLDGAMIAVASPNQLQLEIQMGMIKVLPLKLKGATRTVALIARQEIAESSPTHLVLEALRKEARTMFVQV